MEGKKQELENKIAKLRKELAGTVPQDRYQRSQSMAQRQIILDEIREYTNQLKKIDSEERKSSRTVSQVADKTISQTILEKNSGNGNTFSEVGRRRVKVNM